MDNDQHISQFLVLSFHSSLHKVYLLNMFYKSKEAGHLSLLGSDGVIWIKVENLKAVCDGETQRTEFQFSDMKTWEIDWEASIQIMYSMKE